MNPIEAAATEYNRTHRVQALSSSGVKHILLAFCRAAFGCPICWGTAHLRSPNPRGSFELAEELCQARNPDHPGHPHTCRCPAEHVKITVLGQTIWADPDKCIWWCQEHYAVSDAVSTVRMKPAPYCEANHGAGCGWQPRWDTINTPQ